MFHFETDEHIKIYCGNINKLFKNADCFFCTLSVFLKESTVEDFPSKLFSMTTELICSALFHIKHGYILLSSTKSSSLFSFKQVNPFHVKKDIILKIYAIFIQFHLFNFHYHCSSVLVFLFYQK